MRQIRGWRVAESRKRSNLQRQHQNSLSGAVGLIQFMPATAKGLGTSPAALKKMTPLAQLDFVRQYFLPSKGKLKDLNDVYMAILWPRAVGRPASYILFAR
jgi:hypothetical protein